MRHQYRIFAIALCVMACIASVANAKSTAPKVISFSDATPADVAVIVQGWQEKFEKGDVLLNGKKATAYENDVAKLLAELDQLESWSGLNDQQKTKIANQYEELRAQTDGGIAAGNRRICSVEKRVGSNMRSTVCVTAADQARRDKLNQSVLSDIERNGRRQHVGGQ
jgi:hypothetical protein